MTVSKFLLSCAIALLPILHQPADAAQPTGSVRGSVHDRDTGLPLIGANVFLLGTTRGAATTVDGTFSIDEVPVGSYTLQASYIGYDPVRIPDVIVRSDRPTTVRIDLKLSYLESDAVEITAGYFAAVEEQPVGIVSLSREEIRRAPGAAGDISRIVQGLPSISKVNDQYNGLIVRGGSPLENIFYVDNIEIPNINHFPTQGSTGGAVGLLYVDFIEDVDFYSGGFPAPFGSRLSSVMDIRFREGNRERLDVKLFMDMAGFGAVAEGPLPAGKGSWLMAARRSYVDFLVELMDLVVAPVYVDLQFKAVYDLSTDHRLGLISVIGHDTNDPTRKQAEQLDFSVYGNEKYTQSTAGLTWRWLWGTNGFSNTSLSHSSLYFRNNWSGIRTDGILVRNRSSEHRIGFRNSNRMRLHPGHTLEFGFDGSYLFNDYDTFFGETLDPLGNPSPPLYYISDLRATSVGGFVHYVVRPWERLQAAAGIRSDYHSYTGRFSASPRISFTYLLSGITSLNGSVGLYTQTLPLFLLAQHEGNKSLRNPESMHYILGIGRLLSEDTKLTVEAYLKKYRYMPLNPAQPSLFILDETFYGAPIHLAHAELTDRGKAEAKGIEIVIQKKLAKDFYGIAGATYSVAEYTDYNGIMRNRVVDNRYILNLEGGYKPGRNWEFSLRWIYAGGTPYTPFDLEKSQAANSGIFDTARINGERHPAYHSLSIRADRRFHFSRSNLVLYLNVWNVYDRKNVASYYWNEFRNEQGIQYQWGIMPVFGVEFEF